MWGEAFRPAGQEGPSPGAQTLSFWRNREVPPWVLVRWEGLGQPGSKNDYGPPDPQPPTPGPAAMAKEVGMPMMRRSCISTVSCLGLTRGGAGRAPPYLTPQSSSLLPLHNPHSSSRGGPLSHPPLFPCVPSQSPNSPHIRGSPELWGPAAGCSSVCQGAGCEKRHAGEEPWNRQARHPGSLVRWEAPPLPPPSRL